MKKVVIGVIVMTGLLFASRCIQEGEANGSGEPPLCFPGAPHCPSN